MKTTLVLSMVEAERIRQEQLRESGKFKYTCAEESSEFSDEQKFLVLLEEIGEVAKAVLERSKVVATDGLTFHGRPIHADADLLRRQLRVELIQVAAVAAAWAESVTVITETR